MIALCFGTALALAAMVAALGVASALPLAKFPTIAFACSANGLSMEACRESAFGVGAQSVLAFSLALAAGLVLLRCGARLHPDNRRSLPPIALDILLICAFLLVGAHVCALIFGPVHASRLDESDYFSNFVSLENLIWPLLVQAYAMESDGYRRVCFATALAFVMTLTPFRAVLVAIFVFAFAVPPLAAFWRSWSTSGRTAAAGTLARDTVAMLAVGAICLWGGYIDTKTRAPSMALAEMNSRTLTAVAASASAPRRAEVPVSPRSEPAVEAKLHQLGAHADIRPVAPAAAPLPPAELGARMLQRIAFPLYQAAIAAQLAHDPNIPTIGDEFSHKFRLSSAPTLEQFLFRKIFGGESAGQATSLYYGEAAVYMPGPPLLWMMVAPMLLIAIAAVWESRRIDTGTLFGIALWRSSFSGLVPIIPALVLQLGALAALTRLRVVPGFDEQRSPHVKRCIGGLLVASVGFLLVVQLLLLSRAPERQSVLVAQFTVADKCVLTSPSWIAIRVDQAFAKHGLSISAASIAATNRYATMAVPYGSASAAWLGDVTDHVATLVHCTHDNPHPIVATIDRVLAWTPNPLEFAAALLALIAFVAGVRGKLQTSTDHNAPRRTVVT